MTDRSDNVRKWSQELDEALRPMQGEARSRGILMTPGQVVDSDVVR